MPAQGGRSQLRHPQNLLEFDDVANDQRKVVYEQRNELLDTNDISGPFTSSVTMSTTPSSTVHPAPVPGRMWDVPGLEARLKSDFALDLPLQQWLAEDDKL